MKVLLVKPVSSMHVILPPIGLGYLASYCQREVPGIDIRILDCHREKYSQEDFVRYIGDYNPDVIGFTALSMEIDSALKYAKTAKQVSDKAIIAIGGPHASAVPRQVLSHSFVDFVFIGEAEKGFSYFLNSFTSPEKFKAPGLAYRKNDDIVINQPEFIDNLDVIPFPDYKKMEFDKYPKMYFMKRFPAAPIISSRGCPFSCSFCAGHRVSGRKWRPRSVGSILDEINYLHKEYKIKEINFWDDNFTLDKSRVEEFCRSLRALGKDIIWWCPNGVHLNTLDKGLLTEMKKSGCYAIAFGVESGSERIQRDMKKKLSFDKLKEMVKFSYSIGFRTQGFFIIGYPTESEEDILKTIELSHSLPFLRASFCLFQPIVGSEIYQNLIENKLIDEGENTVTTCDYSKTSIPTKYIKDTSRIKKLQKRAILSFYLKPRVFFRLLLENMSLSQVKEILLIVRQYILVR